jgi:threonine aldolase
MLVDIVVGQESVGSLGVGPVLACERDRASDVAAEFLKQAAQSLAQSRVAEVAAGDLAGYP